MIDMVDEEYVLVPQKDIDEIEEARLAIFKLFPDPDSIMIMNLLKISNPMWKVTHKRYNKAIGAEACKTAG